MLRRRDTKTRRARELARLLAALDAAGSDRRAVAPARRGRASLGTAGGRT